MDDARSREEEEQARPRPRVVDKRVSARPPDSATPAPAQAPVAPEPAPVAPPSNPVAPIPTTAPPPAGAAAPPSEPLWTPEQEAQAEAIAQEITETPARDWVLNTAVTLANVAATKLDAGMAEDAQLAIDALSALVNGLRDRLGDAEAPLRQTVAQLQMAFTQSFAPPGGGTGLGANG